MRTQEDPKSNWFQDGRHFPLTAKSGLGSYWGSLGASWEQLWSTWVARCQVWNGVGNAKHEKMKAMEETHDKSENRLAFERNDGQRLIPDKRRDLCFGHLPFVIRYRKCNT